MTHPFLSRAPRAGLAAWAASSWRRCSGAACPSAPWCGARTISAQDIQEKVDGREARVTVVVVTLEPGQAGVPHRHPGPGFVYVLEGEYELGMDDRPTKVFEAGETYYEPTGCLHRVSRNPAANGRTRLIAVVLHPRDAKEIAVPESRKDCRSTINHVGPRVVDPCHKHT